MFARARRLAARSACAMKPSPHVPLERARHGGSRTCALGKDGARRTSGGARARHRRAFRGFRPRGHRRRVDPSSRRGETPASAHSSRLSFAAVRIGVERSLKRRLAASARELDLCPSRSSAASDEADEQRVADRMEQRRAPRRVRRRSASDAASTRSASRERIRALGPRVEPRSSAVAGGSRAGRNGARRRGTAAASGFPRRRRWRCGASRRAQDGDRDAAHHGGRTERDLGAVAHDARDVLDASSEFHARRRARRPSCATASTLLRAFAAAARAVALGVRGAIRSSSTACSARFFRGGDAVVAGHGIGRVTADADFSAARRAPTLDVLGGVQLRGRSPPPAGDEAWPPSARSGGLRGGARAGRQESRGRGRGGREKSPERRRRICRGRRVIVRLEGRGGAAGRRGVPAAAVDTRRRGRGLYRPELSVKAAARPRPPPRRAKAEPRSGDASHRLWRFRRRGGARSAREGASAVCAAASDAATARWRPPRRCEMAAGEGEGDVARRRRRLPALPRDTAPAVASAPRRSSMRSPWSSPKLKESHAAGVVATDAARSSARRPPRTRPLCSVRHLSCARSLRLWWLPPRSRSTNAPSPPPQVKAHVSTVGVRVLVAGAGRTRYPTRRNARRGRRDRTCSVVAAARAAPNAPGLAFSNPPRSCTQRARGVAGGERRGGATRAAPPSPRARVSFASFKPNAPERREVRARPGARARDRRWVDALDARARRTGRGSRPPRVHQRGVGGVRVQVARPRGARRQRRRRAGARACRCASMPGGRSVAATLARSLAALRAALGMLAARHMDAPAAPPAARARASVGRAERVWPRGAAAERVTNMALAGARLQARPPAFGGGARRRRRRSSWRDALDHAPIARGDDVAACRAR